MSDTYLTREAKARRDIDAALEAPDAVPRAWYI
jgi:hypothetical protein